MGIIDTLGRGLDTVNKRLWLLLLPIGLDLFLWVGPKLSVATLVGQLPSDLFQGQDAQAYRQFATDLNLLFLLALYVPVLFTRWPFTAASLPGVSQWEWSLDGATLGLAAAVLLPLGLFLAMAYLGTAGETVRTELPDWRALPRRIVRYWTQALLLHLLLLGLAGLLAVPWAALIISSSLVSPGLASSLVILLQVTMLWLLFYLFFALDAVVVSDAGPVQAAVYSLRVVRHNFWSALGLVILITVIGNGIPLIWKALAREVWGVPLAIAGNAYFGTWLMVSSMLYYRDRVGRLPADTRDVSRRLTPS